MARLRYTEEFTVGCHHPGGQPNGRDARGRFVAAGQVVLDPAQTTVPPPLPGVAANQPSAGNRCGGVINRDERLIDNLLFRVLLWGTIIGGLALLNWVFGAGQWWERGHHMPFSSSNQPVVATPPAQQAKTPAPPAPTPAAPVAVASNKVMVEIPGLKEVVAGLKSATEKLAATPPASPVVAAAQFPAEITVNTPDLGRAAERLAGSIESLAQPQSPTPQVHEATEEPSPQQWRRFGEDPCADWVQDPAKYRRCRMWNQLP